MIVAISLIILMRWLCI